MVIDRIMDHSGKSVAFFHDYQQAEEKSVRLKKTMLIELETTRCGLCAQMNSYA